MFDKDTLVISYDKGRGEPRGSRRKAEDHKNKGLGDCIDCTMCVQVCPTGIDIRNGLQYECIACAACIDVCDQVMDKMDYPKGLIRYTTENAVEGNPKHILRPRVIVYSLILLGMFALFAYGIIFRTPLELDVIRDRNTLYRETFEGLIENVYTLKIVNMDDMAHTYSLAATGITGLQLHQRYSEIRVEAGEVVEIPVWLRADPADLTRRSSEVMFTLQAMDASSLVTTSEARFLGPLPRR